MVKVSKEMTISEILDIDKGVAPIFMQHGMHCLGCIAASGESLEEACMAHGIDADDLTDKLNKYLENN